MPELKKKKLPFFVPPNIINDAGKNHWWMLRTVGERLLGYSEGLKVSSYRLCANYKEEDKWLK